MAMLNKTELNVEKTGVSCSVPDNPKAKLMYYLNCICNLLNLDEDGDISNLRNYQRYYALTEGETHQLLLLCALLEPSELLNKCIFQNDDMCGDSSNEFYKLSQVNTTLAVASTLVIGGTRRRVQKIMTFKMSWLRNNFIEPFKELTETMQQTSQQRRAAAAKKKDTCLLM